MRRVVDNVKAIDIRLSENLELMKSLPAKSIDLIYCDSFLFDLVLHNQQYFHLQIPLLLNQQYNEQMAPNLF